MGATSEPIPLLDPGSLTHSMPAQVAHPVISGLLLCALSACSGVSKKGSPSGPSWRPTTSSSNVMQTLMMLLIIIHTLVGSTLWSVMSSESLTILAFSPSILAYATTTTQRAIGTSWEFYCSLSLFHLTSLMRSDLVVSSTKPEAVLSYPASFQG